jgi:serine/threonine protein phosphatase 1
MRRMIGLLQHLRRDPLRPPARAPDGMRLYAIGDVHGRMDLLTGLLARIQADDAARGGADTHVILLGDLIDRGAQSAGLIEYLRAFRPTFASFRFVKGNHEAAMLDSLDDETGDPHETGWLDYGGTETLASYGVPQHLHDLPGPALVAALHHYIPRAHLKFLREFEDCVLIGDYLFVHAGIRPGVPLAAQKPQDLRWIRAEFLNDTRHHAVTVVHGHTICEAPEFRHNRIGIDTGAYRTGILTALGLEGAEQWTLATAPAPNEAEAEPATGAPLGR